MPHIASARPGWQLVCQELGYGYIDPRWSIEAILTAIRHSEVLISEALHGAIVADAMRIPWIAVQSNELILSLKWRDWCASIEVDYEPTYLLPYWLPNRDCNFYRRCRNWGRRKRVELDLLRIGRLSASKLSRDGRLAELKDQLWRRLDILRSDIASNGYTG